MDDEIEDDMSSSPISGSMCEIKEIEHYRFYEEAFGTWGCISDLPARMNLGYDKPYKFMDVELSQEQAASAIALFRSKVWLAQAKNLPPPFLHLDTIIEEEGEQEASRYGAVQPTEMGLLHTEVKSLTLNTRAYYTLYNLSMAKPPGWLVSLPFDLSSYPG